MDSILQLAEYVAGTVCLGVALVASTFLQILNRRGADESEGCLGLYIIFVSLGLGAFLFYKAATW
jgi:hypothetical protein